MASAYSQDLRERVIDAVLVDGMSCRAAARRFGVSVSSAIKWVQRVRRTGERGPAGTGGHRPSVLAPERDWLLAVLVADPGITLAALAKRLLNERNVRADPSMLSRFLRREGLTYKKRRFTPASRTVRTWPEGGSNGRLARAGSIPPG